MDDTGSSAHGLSADAVAGFAEFAEAIVREAGAKIRRRFSAQAFSVEAKEDGTPVTEADREAEEFLRGRISAECPSHGIIGEEFGSERTDREFVWVLDPIDGTKSFVHGVPLFGTLLGLLHRGRPVVGVIHQPVLDRTVVGDNRSAWSNGVEAKVRSERSLADATVLLTDPAHARLRAAGEPFRTLLGEAGLVRSWGDCFGYLALATGRADVMFDPELSPWDLLPLLPVLRGAGATVSGFDGHVPEDGSSLVASTGRALHDRVLAALAAHSSSDAG